MNNLISVIVPVYKVEAYLKKCVDSILAQTYRNIEIVLVDDGSPDRCPEICEEYTRLDRRVRVVHKENGGLSDARNFGIDAAHGSLIGFVDSDDFIKPDMFEILLRDLNESASVIACCRFTKLYADGHTEDIGDGSFSIFDGTDALKEYLIGTRVDPFACNKLYRRSAIGNTRFIKGILGEDNLFNYEVFGKANRVSLREVPLYVYLQDRVGAITDKSISRKKVNIIYNWDNIRRKCKMEYPELEIYALRRQVIYYIGMYNTITNSGSNFSEDINNIKSFVREHLDDITHDTVFEKTVKLSAFLLIKAPALYRIIMKLYKKKYKVAKL